MGTVRFLLALCVVVSHSPGSNFLGYNLLSAITAVQAFYIISGFLITMVLNESHQYQSVRNYNTSRYLRLWPSYVVVAALTLLITNGGGLAAYLPKLDSPAAAFVLFSNATLFFQDWFLFLEPIAGTFGFTSSFTLGAHPWLVEYLIVPQCWTLGVELTFYAIAPFICRSFLRVLLLFAAGVLVRLAIGYWQPPIQDPWLYRFSPAEMTLFAAGGLGYFAGIAMRRLLPRAVLLAVSCLAFVALVAIIAGNDAVTPWIQTRWGWWWPSLWMMNGPILVIVAIACPFLFYGTSSIAIDRLLGELSYPMYISHLLIITFLVQHFSNPWIGGHVPYVLLVIGFSFALYFFVGAPVDRLRKRFGASATAADAELVQAHARPAISEDEAQAKTEINYTVPQR
jgi:peptidoglycan/LPS O-acetylase OafA/YrhL